MRRRHRDCQLLGGFSGSDPWVSPAFLKITTTFARPARQIPAAWSPECSRWLCHTGEGEVPTHIRCSAGRSHVANQLDALLSKRHTLRRTLEGSEYISPENPAPVAEYSAGQLVYPTVNVAYRFVSETRHNSTRNSPNSEP